RRLAATTYLDQRRRPGSHLYRPQPLPHGRQRRYRADGQFLAWHIRQPMPAACTDAEKERAMDLRLTWLKLIWPLLAGAILLASSGRLRAEDISVPDGTSADGVSEEADHADAAATEGSIPYKSLLSILRDGGLLM